VKLRIIVVLLVRLLAGLMPRREGTLVTVFDREVNLGVGGS
jgi:hypothetical protein